HDTYKSDVGFLMLACYFSIVLSFYFAHIEMGWSIVSRPLGILALVLITIMLGVITLIILLKSDLNSDMALRPLDTGAVVFGLIIFKALAGRIKRGAAMETGDGIAPK